MEEYIFNDETEFKAGDKEQILLDWHRFIHSGFKKVFFSDVLWRMLKYHCAFSAHYGRESFWPYYFSADIEHLRRFLNQFAGTGLSAEGGTQEWLTAAPAVDLKAAMCREMGEVYEPVTQVLNDLEYQHSALVQVWYDFANESGLEGVALPAAYSISENGRNLLAFAIRIALKERLRGLQLRFPMPLVYPVDDNVPA